LKPSDEEIVVMLRAECRERWRDDFLRFVKLHPLASNEMQMQK